MSRRRSLQLQESGSSTLRQTTMDAGGSTGGGQGSSGDQRANQGGGQGSSSDDGVDGLAAGGRIAWLGEGST